MRRIHISTRAQGVAAISFLSLLSVSSFGILQFAIGTPALSGAISDFAAHQVKVSQMERRVAALQIEVVAIRTSAKQHAARLESRQVFLATMLKGDANLAKLAAMVPVRSSVKDAAIAAVFANLEQKQLAMASAVESANDQRYRETAVALSRLGISPAMLRANSRMGVGGPYEPVVEATNAKPVKAGQADPQFRALFNSWKRLDQLQDAVISIPTSRPVHAVSVNSGFGIRSDPFRGGRAMHAGVDIPGPYGTPVFATADGVAGRTGWIGGYGNLVELEHGKGIQTRYGHLSSIIISAGARVKRGQLIGLMGSTGRSTGNHLHYEIRIDGRAVNPMPFLQPTDYLLALQQRSGPVETALGGPVGDAGK